LQRRGDARQDAPDVGVDEALGQERADRPDEGQQQKQQQRQRQRDRAQLDLALAARETAGEPAVPQDRRRGRHRYCITWPPRR
jgi:hypothetical protein